jgi:hypothetical protein
MEPSEPEEEATESVTVEPEDAVAPVETALSDVYLPLVLQGDNAVETDSVSLATLPESNTCELYPLVLDKATFSNLRVGSTFSGITNGTQYKQWGWVTWAGDPSEGRLLQSLTPPGDSASYINPENSADRTLSVSDWLVSRPDADNTEQLRAAMETLKTLEITVPVWGAKNTSAC